jgi:putative endonuclease
MLLGDGCQAVGVVRYLLNGSKFVQLVEALRSPTLAQVFDRFT